MSSTQIAKMKTRSSTCDSSRIGSVAAASATSSSPRTLSQSLDDKCRRLSIGVALMSRLSGSAAARRGSAAHDDSALSASRRRSEIDSLRACSGSETELHARFRCSHVSQQQAAAIDEELFGEYGFSVDQLMELAGLAAAVAFTRAYPRESLIKGHGAVLVCCGPGNNGGDGLVCARHLKIFGYQPTIFYPRVTNKPLFKNLLQQCEKFEIPSLAYLPGDPNSLQQSFNVLVDAVFGFSFKPPVREEFLPLMRAMRQISLPVFSIDIPSGWDVEKGPANDDAIQPDVLISLTAPKQCARYFQGRKHFLGGRFVPCLLAQKYNLRLPEYPGTELVVELPVSSGSNVRNDSEADCGNSTSPDSVKVDTGDVWGAT